MLLKWLFWSFWIKGSRKKKDKRRKLQAAAAKEGLKRPEILRPESILHRRRRAHAAGAYGFFSDKIKRSSIRYLLKGALRRYLNGRYKRFFNETESQDSA